MCRHFTEPKAAESTPGPQEHGNSELESYLVTKGLPLSHPVGILWPLVSLHDFWFFLADDILYLCSPILYLCLPRGTKMDRSSRAGLGPEGAYLFSLAATLTSILNVNSKVPEKRVLFQGVTPFPSAVAKYGCRLRRQALEKWRYIMGWADTPKAND